MTLPSDLNLVTEFVSNGTLKRHSTALRSLSMFNFNRLKKYDVRLINKNTDLFHGNVVDSFLWLTAHIDCNHYLNHPFSSIFNPKVSATFSEAFFTHQMKNGGFAYGDNSSERVRWLWEKMHEPFLLDTFLTRFTAADSIPPTILDGIFPFICLHINPHDLHTDPLWVAWWCSSNGAQKLGGAATLENLCLSGNAEPTPEFIAQTPQLASQFFRDMNWDTLLSRQIFNGAAALGEFFDCNMAHLIFDQRERLDKIYRSKSFRPSQTVGQKIIEVVHPPDPSHGRDVFVLV